MQVQERRWLAGRRSLMTQIWRELEFKAEIYSRNKTLWEEGVERNSSNITEEEAHMAGLPHRRAKLSRLRMRPDAKADQTRSMSTCPWTP